MVTFGVAVFFWGVLALWLLSYVLPLVLAGVRLVATVLLWVILVVCGGQRSPLRSQGQYVRVVLAGGLQSHRRRSS
ncbi:hypothetical protein ACO2Q1_01495 [Brevundimonas sp. VNH65]|uniref:hypothetical protein n=1 Tax=Brevundimonas sp. VNH65 TaxID=3400917 RepID=UPI003C1147DA